MTFFILQSDVVPVIAFVGIFQESCQFFFHLKFSLSLRSAEIRCIAHMQLFFSVLLLDQTPKQRGTWPYMTTGWLYLKTIIFESSEMEGYALWFDCLAVFPISVTFLPFD